MEKFQCLISKDIKIKDAIKRMTVSVENKFIAGFAVVVDEESKLIGVITDGDIRRGILKGIDIESNVERIANFDPMAVNYNQTKSQMAKDIMDKCEKRDTSYKKYSKIVLIDDENKFYDVVSASDIFEEITEPKNVAVYGMGYIGLTLAVVLANTGFKVTGIEKNEVILNDLKKSKLHFYEDGLESLIQSTLQNCSLKFLSPSSQINADIHIICVGTPFDKESMNADLNSIIEVTRNIAKNIKKDNLVIIRSTVPLGTTRNIVIPILEESGLKAGEDFCLSFAPERTIEGNAIEELRTLPQVIGGINRKSFDFTSRFFSKITKTIVEVNSLEEAEMVKLMNNTFRDLVFSFSNEVSYICEKLNINTFKLVEAANDGYVRNPIPKPSPGVGGLCLSKDPYLYSLSESFFNGKAILGNISRQINNFGPIYINEKILKFCNFTKKDINKVKFFIIGIAFKGMPETSDIRDSVAVELIKMLPDKKNIFIKDFVVPKKDIIQTGCNYIEDIIEGFKEIDIVLVLNNHYKNNKFNLMDTLVHTKKPCMFFDGWNQFNQAEIEKFNEIYYSTLGYITKR
jgi:UDP-N-acetyl-D-mannosaminuronic acid dehydrogenase